MMISLLRPVKEHQTSNLTLRTALNINLTASSDVFCLVFHYKILHSLLLHFSEEGVVHGILAHRAGVVISLAFVNCSAWSPRSIVSVHWPFSGQRGVECAENLQAGTGKSEGGTFTN